MRRLRWLIWLMLSVFSAELLFKILDLFTGAISSSALASTFNIYLWNAWELFMVLLLVSFLRKKEDPRLMIPGFVLILWKTLILITSQLPVLAASIEFLSLAVIIGYLALLLFDRIGIIYHPKWLLPLTICAVAVWIVGVIIEFGFILQKISSLNLSTMLVWLAYTAIICIEIWFSYRLRDSEWLETDLGKNLEKFLKRKDIILPVNIIYWIFLTINAALVIYSIFSLSYYPGAVFLIIIQILFIYIVTRLLQKKRVYAGIFLMLGFVVPAIALFPYLDIQNNYSLISGSGTFLKMPVLLTYLLTILVTIFMGYWTAKVCSKLAQEGYIIAISVYLSSIISFLFGLLSAKWAYIVLNMGETGILFELVFKNIMVDVINIPIIYLITLILFNSAFIRYAGKSKLLSLYIVPFAVYVITSILAINSGIN